MNKLIVLGKIYKNGSLATSKNGKSYIGFTIIDSRKTIEESVKFRGVAFEYQAKHIDEWCQDGDRILAIGTLEKDVKTNSFKFTLNEFTRIEPKEAKSETLLKQENQEEDIF